MPKPEHPSPPAAETRPAIDAEEVRAEREREIEFAVSERVIFFTDAVIAIAITLLALELPTPEGHTAREMLHSLAEQGNEFLAFLISFLVVASHWNVHRRAFRHLSRVSRPVVALNTTWLLLTILTPFTTRVLNTGDLNLFSFGLYAATQACQFGVFSVLVAVVVRTRAVHEDADLVQLRRTLQHTIPIGIGFAASIPLYLLIQQGAFALWFFVPFGTGLWDRARSRRARH